MAGVYRYVWHRHGVPSPAVWCWWLGFRCRLLTAHEAGWLTIAQEALNLEWLSTWSVHGRYGQVRHLQVPPVYAEVIAWLPIPSTCTVPAPAEAEAEAEQ
jgi:hypothetical protein